MNTNSKNNMRHYGNGIHASNDFLAQIAADAIAQEKCEREARLKYGNAFKGYGTWNISDRH
jgi:hypothetical protein